MNLDNYFIKDLKYILNEDTTLKRNYGFIDIKDDIINSLNKNNIYTKSDFDDAYLNNKEELLRILSFKEKELQAFYYLVHLHDFKNRKLKEISFITENELEKMFNKNIKTSFDLFSILDKLSVSELAKTLELDKSYLQKIIDICDLMRLPGVKDIRATLYYDSNLHGLTSFKQNYEVINLLIDNYIKESNTSKMKPLVKELKTQIAVANLLPSLVIVE